MGATDYINVGKGKSAREVFDRLTEQARWEHGHGGYTGTIAEKDRYVEFKRPKGMRRATAIQAVRDLGGISDLGFGDWPTSDAGKAIQAKYPKLPIAAMYEVWTDKWGPSLAIEISKGEYLFAGFASE
jgi:hypothetical protein